MAKSYKLKDDNYIDSGSISHNRKSLKEVLGVVLYKDSTGTTGNVTLTKNAEDYDIIEIFYTSGSRSGSVRIRDFSNNEKISLNLTGTSASSFINIVKEVAISGISITKISERNFMVSGGGSSHSFVDSDTIRITKVVGYK